MYEIVKIFAGNNIRYMFVKFPSGKIIAMTISSTLYEQLKFAGVSTSQSYRSKK